MIESEELIKWRNISLPAALHTGLFLVTFLFGVQYQNNGDILLLIVCFAFIIISIVSLVISFFTWNRFIYLNVEKFWKRKKNKMIEWKIENINSCRVIRWPCWTSIFSVEITSSDNPKKLIFEYNAKVERILMQITKNKPNRDIFEKAFK
ncbi:MAG TPA: hypothetical protein PK340_04940 [Bacilli bacterium]|nr:hypothetical protein [Bacilli bacterium]